MDDRWKPIAGYEGLYEVSDKGNVRRLCEKHPEGRPIKPQLDKDGYEKVCLCKNNNKKTYAVHRLVAAAFIPNPDNYPVINHIDENKTNNAVSNLEWCSIKYNNNYNNGMWRRASKRRIPIIAIKGAEILRFKSIQEASEKLCVSHANILGCLKKCYGRKTCKGYTFEYARKG